MAGNDGNGRRPTETVIRPTPGGARGAGVTPGPEPTQLPRDPGARARPLAGPAPGQDAAVEEFIARGANPIIAAAGPLLSLGATIGASVYQADVEALRARAIEAVKIFEAQTRQAGVEADDIRIGRYIVCTYVDLAIFQTPWGGRDVWAARSLLVLFEKDNNGGVTFFDLLERLSKKPERYGDLLELQHACLALGFQGKYRSEPDGKAQLQVLQDRLYRLIRTRRPAPGNALAAHWRGLAEPKPRAWRLVPWWVVALAALAVLLTTLIVLRARLSDAAGPSVALLAQRGLDTGYAPVPVAATPSRLKALLAAEEQAGTLKVEEFGRRTLITLEVPDLFPSGSAAVAPGHEAVFAAIGRALEAVPGRITIIGHTDDQPVRSLRYDNFALSRARALAVAALIKTQLSNASRVEWSGLGSTQPRYEPPSLPDNRARNRRVEIVHQAE